MGNNLSLIDKSITMKTIITFTFLLLTLSVFSQTTREEVVKRTDYGHKVIVNTYSGTGNSEKLVKRTTYCNYEKSISLKPKSIEYFGGYKASGTSDWGVIKIDEYDGNGVLVSTWKTTNTLIP